jgi:hypothetical protein
MRAHTAVGGGQRSELPSATVDATQILDILDRALAAERRVLSRQYRRCRQLPALDITSIPKISTSTASISGFATIWENGKNPA